MFKKLSDIIDFVYGYMLFKAYFFNIKTNVCNMRYPNESYARKWREFVRSLNVDALNKALKLVIEKADTVFSGVLNIYDCFDRASYFALIHPDHPNITLGFVKDADLWDMWLTDGIYKIVREVIAEVADISNGDKVADFGCGSASPTFYGTLVGSSGIYTGIDYSKPLLNLAYVRIKDEKIADRVNLRREYVDSKLVFRRSYDIVICSSILQYVDLKSTLTNAVNALNGEGTIVVFSETFSDVDPEKTKLFELYYSLIPSFKKFPSIKEISEILDPICDYRYKLIDTHLLKIEVNNQ